jgi:hypothetical protein
MGHPYITHFKYTAAGTEYNMNTMVGITCFIFAATPFSFPTITLAPSETKLLQLAISKPFYDSKCLIV